MTEIRELSTIHELDLVGRLQLAVWGEDDTPIDAHLLVAIQHAGGLVAGAFAGEVLVGFVLGFPTSDAAVQWSHAMGIDPYWRGQGLSVSLKEFQREWCLERGIERVRWTFDPLRVVNANLNMRRLGATSRDYVRDIYGPMVGINAGVPSDRLIADWDLRTPSIAHDDVLAEPANEPTSGAPGRAVLDLDVPYVLVHVPPDFSQMLVEEHATAIAWRYHGREVFEAYLARGYQVADFRAADRAYVLVAGEPVRTS